MNRLLLMGPMVAIAILTNVSLSHGQMQTLVRHLPEGANTLALFNVEEILESPIGQKENWREEIGKMYSSGLILVPPQATMFVAASQMDIELMEPHWHASVMNLSFEPSMIEITQRYGGNVDEVDGQEAAVLSNDTYVVKFGKFIAGTMSPADRQKATLWVEHAYSSSNTHPLSEYLTEAESFSVEKKTPIILAIDLQHVLSPKLIRSRLGSAESLKGKTVDLDQLAKVLASIRGATLGVNVTDHFFGGLKVDFAEDVSMMKDYAKPLLLEVLARHGAMIQEFSTWDIEVGGKEILLRGSFTSSGIQRVCSILDTPADLRAAEPSKGADGKENPNLVAQTTLQYYKMLAQFLSDLRNEQQTATTETPGLVAMWYKQYANKIDGMPVLHVDPGLVQLGGQISGALRQAQAAMQGAGVKEASGIANMQARKSTTTKKHLVQPLPKDVMGERPQSPAMRTGTPTTRGPR